MERPRYTEKLVEGHWQQCELKDVKPGEIFRGYPLDISQESREQLLRFTYKAVSEPFTNDGGNWTVDVEVASVYGGEDKDDTTSTGS